METQAMAINEKAMQRSSTNGLSLPGQDKARFLRLGGFINKLRTVQGWNMLPPDEVVHLAAVWDEQLIRKGVPESLFDELVNRTVDHRLAFMRRGEQAPAISIELILAVFETYREEVFRSLSGAENRLESAERYLLQIEEAISRDDRAAMDNLLQSANHYSRTLDVQFATVELLRQDALARCDRAKQKIDEWTLKAEPLRQAQEVTWK
jgi:hypothetical protein